jgi:hypothetical protein
MYDVTPSFQNNVEFTSFLRFSQHSSRSEIDADIPFSFFLAGLRPAVRKKLGHSPKSQVKGGSPSQSRFFEHF